MVSYAIAIPGNTLTRSIASIKLWSLSSQRCLHTFTHHTESVWSLFSSHPALEVFYSGDRSGLVCKVDVEGCADVAEGECVVLCQDQNSDRPGSSSAEGINKIVAMDDNLLWTASGSSSVKRWRVPTRRAVRAAALSTESTMDSPVSSPPPIDSPRDYYVSRSAKRNSFDLSGPRSPKRTKSLSPDKESRSSSPLASRSHRASLAPSIGSANLDACASLGIDPAHEGEHAWYGIPFESLVRLTSPNHTGFGPAGRSLRGPDPEIATLYSAASVLSVPRFSRASTAFAGALRSASPGLDGLLRPTGADETQTVYLAPHARAAFDVREVAADAVPLCAEPDAVLRGEHGLVRCALLNDRVHALTVDTAGEVAVWDVVRGACRGRYAAADVDAAAAAARGGGSDDGRSVSERTRSPREALETVRERIEGEAVVPSWCALDTKTGVLTVHMNEKCFEAEVYADEAGYGLEKQFSEETRRTLIFHSALCNVI